jgi:hypothetical protein
MVTVLYIDTIQHTQYKIIYLQRFLSIHAKGAPEVQMPKT